MDAFTTSSLPGNFGVEIKNIDVSSPHFQDRFLTQYQHCVHDLVMWDNPTTMHTATHTPAATGPHDTRLIHRISVKGIPSVFAT